jgi:hypothetical protein
MHHPGQQGNEEAEGYSIIPIINRRRRRRQQQ